MPSPRGQDVRDTIVFAVGIIGILYETFKERADRPILIVLYAAMIGLPPFLRSDEDDGFSMWILRPWMRRGDRGRDHDDQDA